MTAPIAGARRAIASVIPVSALISAGISVPGLTSAEKCASTRPWRTRTAPMSVMCASPGCQPVVSTSTTVNSSASISPAGAPGVMIGAGGRSAVSGDAASGDAASAAAAGIGRPGWRRDGRGGPGWRSAVTARLGGRPDQLCCHGLGCHGLGCDGLGCARAGLRRKGAVVGYHVCHVRARC